MAAELPKTLFMAKVKGADGKVCWIGYETMKETVDILNCKEAACYERRLDAVETRRVAQHRQKGSKNWKDSSKWNKEDE